MGISHMRQQWIPGHSSGGGGGGGEWPGDGTSVWNNLVWQIVHSLWTTLAPRAIRPTFTITVFNS